MNVQEFGTKQLLANCHSNTYPAPGSVEELRKFKKIQHHFSDQFELFFPDNLANKTIVVIPSLSLDQEVVSKLAGALHYEERLLCLLMLLRMPRTHVIYVSSMPIDPVIIDYYLHSLPGITAHHAKERLTLLSCYDMSATPLTQKILQRPRLIDRIKKGIPPGHVAHITCFNTTDAERTLTVRLGIPVYGCDPSLNYWGSKSGSRKIFLSAGVDMPPGVEDLKSSDDIIHAIAAIKAMYPELKKAIIKLNDGFSGDGNAVLRYPDHLNSEQLFDWVNHGLHEKIIPVARDMGFDIFAKKFQEMGGIAEAFLEGDRKASPSVQCRITPLGKVEIISTHDQILGGESGQEFIGALFPCNDNYRKEITESAKKIAEELKKKAVLGRFSIDFISIKENDQWKHFAIEINLRKGGTTHPYLLLQFLTNGQYHEEAGLFEIQNREHRYYFASDNLQNNAYKGLTPQDLIDIAMFHGLQYDSAAQKGVMFHMIGALSQFGKMGIICIGGSREEAYSYYTKTIEVLGAECASI